MGHLGLVYSSTTNDGSVAFGLDSRAQFLKSRLTLILDQKLTKQFISLLPNAVQRRFSAELYMRRRESWKTKISKRNFHQKVENVKQKLTLILD